MNKLILLTAVLLTGCADLQPPPGGMPMYLPPPAPMRPYFMPVPQVTTCTPGYNGTYRCVTR